MRMLIKAVHPAVRNYLSCMLFNVGNKLPRIAILRKAKLLFIAGIILILGNSRSFAQSLWLERGENGTVAFEIMKPNLDDPDNSTLLTSAVYLSVIYPVSNSIVLSGEIPFGFWNSDSISPYFDERERESTIGNIYLGLEIHKDEEPLYSDIGFRLPLTPNSDESGGNAGRAGRYADWVERKEAFIADYIPVIVGINYRQVIIKGLYIRVRVAPSVLISTHGEGQELGFLFTTQLGYKTEMFNFITGFSSGGTGGLYYSDSPGSQLGFATNLNFGRVSPVFFFKIPLEENYMLEWTLGFSLLYHL